MSHQGLPPEQKSPRTGRGLVGAFGRRPTGQPRSSTFRLAGPFQVRLAALPTPVTAVKQPIPPLWRFAAASERVGRSPMNAHVLREGGAGQMRPPGAHRGGSALGARREPQVAAAPAGAEISEVVSCLFVTIIRRTPSARRRRQADDPRIWDVLWSAQADLG